MQNVGKQVITTAEAMNTRTVVTGNLTDPSLLLLFLVLLLRNVFHEGPFTGFIKEILEAFLITYAHFSTTHGFW